MSEVPGETVAIDDARHDDGRILNQAEIDSILDKGNVSGGGDHTNGIEKIINSGFISYERLPMLEIIFDRLLRIMSTSLRNFTNDNVEVTSDGIRSLRFRDYVDSVPQGSVFIVFKAEDWENYGLMVVDSALIYSIVDVLLGGQRGNASMRIEGRPYTTIERSLVEQMVKIILSDLSASFNPICAINFRFERLEVNSRFAAIAHGSNAAVMTRIRVDMEDRGGEIDLILPYATLEPVRELLLQQFMGEKFGRDSIWETHLAEELWNTDVELQVVLDEQTLALIDLINLKVGERLVLKQGAAATVKLRCGQQILFEGRVGRRKDNVAVKILTEILKQDSDGVLDGAMSYS